MDVRSRVVVRPPAQPGRGRARGPVLWGAIAALALLVIVLIASLSRGGGDFAKLEVTKTQVERRQGQGPFRPADGGRPVAAGDTVRTDRTGQAEINYFDGSLTRLDTDTTFVVSNLARQSDSRQLEFDLKVGRSWNRVSKLTSSEDRFDVKTPVAVASVRGTTFMVDCRRLPFCTFTTVRDLVALNPLKGRSLGLSTLRRVTIGPDGPGDVEEVTLEELLKDPWVADNLRKDGQAPEAARPLSVSSPNSGAEAAQAPVAAAAAAAPSQRAAATQAAAPPPAPPAPALDPPPPLGPPAAQPNVPAENAPATGEPAAAGGQSPQAGVVTQPPADAGPATTAGQTTTTLATSANPSLVGEPVTYTATVGGGPASEGTVTFSQDGSSIPGCVVRSLAAGRATCTVTYNAPGTHTIVAAYSGTSAFGASSSPAQSQRVVRTDQPAPTTTSVGSSSNPSAVGQQVTYTAVVGGGPTSQGNVTFFDGPLQITGCGGQPLASSQTSCSVTYGSSGSHSIVARYNGTADFAPSTSGTVTQQVGGGTTPPPPPPPPPAPATSTSLSSSNNPSTIGQPVVYTATVTGGPTSDGTVTFNDAGAPISGCAGRPLSSGQSTCSIAYYDTPGSHPITAAYSGTTSFAPSTSAPLTQVATVPPPSGRIAFTSERDGNPEIYVMKPDGSQQTRVTSSPTTLDRYPAWSPDEQFIAFTRAATGGPADIFRANVYVPGLANLTNNPADDVDAAWSPDGTKIAFSSNRDGDDYDIYVMNADGTNPQPITNDPADEFEPAWSPDSARFAYVSSRDGGLQIYSMNTDGTGPPVRLTQDPAPIVARDPRWSRDGTKIAFSSNRLPPAIDQVYVMKADGTSPIWLSSSLSTDRHPSWSMDGSEIFFDVDQTPQGMDIYVMNPDGSSQSAITTDPAPDYDPATLPTVGSGPGHGGGVCSVTFANAAGGAWETASNWIPAHVPQSDDYACIPSGTGVVTYLSDSDIGGVDAQGDGLVISGSLILTDSSQDSTINRIDLSGTVTGDADLELTGASIWRSGLLGTTGQIVHRGNTTLALAGALVIDGSFTNVGDIDGSSSPGSICISDGVLFDHVEGTFDLPGDGVLPCAGSGSGAPLLRNSGFIRGGSQSELFETTIATLFDNFGSVVAEGDLFIDGPSSSDAADTGSYQSDPSDRIFFTSGSRTFDGATIDGDGAKLDGASFSGALVLNGTMDWTAGTFDGAVLTGTGIVIAGTSVELLGNLENFAAIRGGELLCLGDFVRLDNSGIFQLPMTELSQCAGTTGAELYNLASGTVVSTGPDATISTAFDNEGTLNVDTGRLEVTGYFPNWDDFALEQKLFEGTFNVGTDTSSAVFAFTGADVVHLGALVSLKSAGSQIQDELGSDALANLAEVRSDGALGIEYGATLTTSASLSNLGLIHLGRMSTLAVAGDYSQDSTAFHRAIIAGSSASGDFGVLQVGGTATLAGTLHIVLEGAYSPTSDDQYDALTYDAVSGEYSPVVEVGADWTVTYGSSAMTIAVTLG